jgi:DNA adenine methylase
MKPFLKWPGGKRWFIAKHAHLLPRNFGRYIEPFLGSGSLFFHLVPERALLGDTNSDLIITYSALRDESCAVEEALTHHQLNHCDEYYYALRNASPRTAAQRAARFIYLNRTCFNGIFRVNLQGTFNVPKGTRDTVIFDDDDFGALSDVLQDAEIYVSDFESLIDKAEENDLVFADPPYTVRHNSNAFIKYNEKLFSWHDQERLADALARARDRGAHILATNANHEAVKKLYRDRSFHLESVSRFSSISAHSKSRNQFEELIALSSDFRSNAEVPHDRK